MPDALFAEPRLAAVYDALDPDRADLDAYLALADELGARSVLDVGCGTGTFACLLAERDTDVTGVDPAAASLEVARRKRGAETVRWIEGDVTAVPPLEVDLVTMTGNVAQVFLTDEEWAAVLVAARAALRPDGWLVFEVRDPEREAWREWTPERTRRRATVPEAVESEVEVTEVRLPFVSFRTTFTFAADGEQLTSESMLRFRTGAEVRASLAAAGFTVQEVRDAPDRPGHELVILARASTAPSGPQG